MLNKSFLLFIFLFFTIIFIGVKPVLAENNFITVVNPIRGEDFWDIKDQNIEDAVVGQAQILRTSKIPATWLIRFDVLKNEKIIEILEKGDNLFEKGLLLEITPAWADAAGISYNKSKNWHDAGSIFLSGYSPKDREKLIDAAFARFKEIFRVYPKSIGAWWVDAYSTDYMYKKYGIEAVLIVSDQYTTDNYQIWGQYFDTPYYPSLKSMLTPAQSEEDKLPIVLMQWAPRDPVNGYGKVVEDSTYSLQPNDYIDYHNLGINYFSSLIDLFSNQKLNSFSQLVIGLENSYSWIKYKDEYQKQIILLKQKQIEGQLSLVTMEDFSNWYKKTYPKISPEQVIVANDVLGSDKKTIWFMNPYYRFGLFYSGSGIDQSGDQGVIIKDIRQYVGGSEEICFRTSCRELNFATFPTRVLDEVTYGKKLVLDRGKIENLNVYREKEKYVISYNNEAGVTKKIELYPRDISIDGKIKTVDETILNILNSKPDENNLISPQKQKINFGKQILEFTISVFKFVFFIFVVILIPGFSITSKLSEKPNSSTIVLSFCAGVVIVVLTGLILERLNIRWLMLPIFVALAIINFKKIFLFLSFVRASIKNIKIYKIEILLIILGIILQGLIVFKSGWLYDFGIGFWGPTGHDGIWHQALSSQLIKNIPPENPIYSGVSLSGYHYFYDLLVAQTTKISSISIEDLIYRFYPFLFSFVLGVLTLILTSKIFKDKLINIFALFLVYFGGSFGWIVEYIKSKTLGGESAFWVNQPVSMNLNPPFALSLLLMLGAVLSIGIESKSRFWKFILVTLLSGTLIEFKAYGGVVLLLSFGIFSIVRFFLKKEISQVLNFTGSLILSIFVFLPSNTGSASLFTFHPFWFVDSMIDFSDRVGWAKLASARESYFSGGKTLKYIAAEIVSFIIFLLGNLGTRFISLFIVFKKNTYLKSESLLLLLIGFFSFSIPLLFIQKGNSWNTIQFMYYFLYIAAIFAAPFYAWLFRKLNIFLRLIVFTIIIIITPISSISTFRTAFYPNPASFLPALENQALGFLKTMPDGVVLTVPYDKNVKQYFKDPQPLLSYDTTSYVSAFSGKSTFLEDEIQQEIFQTDYKKRLVEGKEFFKGSNFAWSKDFLRRNNIKYIYFPKIYGRGLEETKIGIKNIFENKEVIIYVVL